MLRKIYFIVGSAILLFSALPVMAGGWVVITLDRLPSEVHAGEPLEISFMVRQHGKTATHDVFPILSAVDTATGERFQFEAEKEQEIGRYKVSVNFPHSGQWEWSISAEPFPQILTLAPINVLAQEGASESANQAPPRISLGQPIANNMRWIGVLFLVVAAALVILSRRRQTAKVQASSDFVDRS